jgi:PD-(D/E)XK nuclease superfamily
MNKCSPVTRVLAPSAFGFLWSECRRCYYLQVVHDVRRPAAPFPSIFSKIDSAMKRRFAGDQWHSIGKSGPVFKIAHDETMIRSIPVILTDRGVQIVLRGKFDSVLMLRDSRLIVCDFKTSPVKPEHLDKYWVQLHAYAYALENPDLGSLSVPTVHGLGLAVFEPAAFEHDSDNGAALSGQMQWIDMPRDDSRFMSFLDEVASVLECPEPPAAAGGCQYCAFRKAA